jgi:CD2 antigen cytoplasmic tail-binding protein 2
MKARTAQKRSAASAGESSAPHAQKKTRFVDPGDDPANFAEEVDNALENPSAKRKGRVRNEGYESDSSDDGEGVVFSRRKEDAGEADDDGDDDMFAMGDKDARGDKEDEGAAKKKEAFLRLGDIEGQEFNESEDESDEDERAEPEDEDAAERKKRAGMGYELSSFNMREEMEEGKFAADGTYVKTFDPHAVHDRWMDGLDEKEIKKARRRKRQQDRVQREKMKAEERELEQSGGKSALELQLVAMLKRGETVLEALQRLGTKSKKNPTVQKKYGSKNNSSMVVDREPSKGMSDIDLITHLASNIMSLGDTDIYSKTYEELVRAVRSSGQVDQDWVPTSADVKYEYMWDIPGQLPGESFGPFGEVEIKTWFKAAYFGEFGEKVKVRAVGGEWGDWDDVVV